MNEDERIAPVSDEVTTAHLARVELTDRIIGRLEVYANAVATFGPPDASRYPFDLARAVAAPFRDGDRLVMQITRIDETVPWGEAGPLSSTISGQVNLGSATADALQEIIKSHKQAMTNARLLARRERGAEASQELATDGAPAEAHRRRFAETLVQRVQTVQALGWDDLRSEWKRIEVVGVALVLGDTATTVEAAGSETAALGEWAVELWGTAAAAADAEDGYTRTQEWFASIRDTTL
ncbi:hypothetical protein [Tsukamurella hominis]|uniref:hypothetical protein n=1 Tax=Tsukamurella hominis TaxID=1970232 RepID=UPI0039EB0C36